MNNDNFTNNDYYDDSFDDINIVNEKISDIKFDDCIFENCNFNKSIISYCKFVECTFINCDLSLLNIIGILKETERSIIFLVTSLEIISK